MNRRIAVLALGGLMAAGSALAEPTLAGRWQGLIDIPGRPVDATLDLQRNAANEWVGSVDLAQLKVRGAALAEIKVEEFEFHAVIADELGGPGETKASFVGNLDSDGALHGEFQQAGQRVRFVFTRAGDSQVQLPRPRGIVPKTLEGKWTGDFIGSGNYPRHVTITLSNPDRNGSQATFVSVAKQTFEVPVSWLGYGDGFLELESPIGVHYEGKLSADRRHFVGTVVVGSSEFPLNLEHGP